MLVNRVNQENRGIQVLLMNQVKWLDHVSQTKQVNQWRISSIAKITSVKSQNLESVTEKVTEITSKAPHIAKTSQELQMLSLSLFFQGSLWMLRLLFSIVRNVINVSSVRSQVSRIVLWVCFPNVIVFVIVFVCQAMSPSLLLYVSRVTGLSECFIFWKSKQIRKSENFPKI